MRAEGSARDSSPLLAGIARRYPGETSVLGRVFNHTTSSYKLFWFLALLSFIKKGNSRSIRVADLFREVAVAAWHPVCHFHLSLGSQGKLQEVIRSRQLSSGLGSQAKLEAVGAVVEGWESASEELDYFRRYVPTRFLVPWFEGELRGVPDARRSEKIKALAGAARRPSGCVLGISKWAQRWVFGLGEGKDLRGDRRELLGLSELTAGSA